MIVVLGHALERDGTPGPVLRARVRDGVALYLDQRSTTNAPLIVFAGGHPGDGLRGRDKNVSEAMAMHDYAIRETSISSSSASSSILLEDRSTSTWENALFTYDLLDARGAIGTTTTTSHATTIVAVVTSRFHQFRAGRTFAAAARRTDRAVDVRVAEAISASNGGSPAIVAAASAAYHVLREVAAIAYYAARGRL